MLHSTSPTPPGGGGWVTWAGRVEGWRWVQALGGGVVEQYRGLQYQGGREMAEPVVKTPPWAGSGDEPEWAGFQMPSQPTPIISCPDRSWARFLILGTASRAFEKPMVNLPT